MDEGDSHQIWGNRQMDTDCDLFTDVDLVCYQFAAGYQVFVK